MEDFEFVPDPNAHLSAMGGIALRISELLLSRPWWIAEFDSPALLTSDEPVALHLRDRSRPPGHDRGIAYADEIWFPLDPRRLLILGSSGDPLPEQRLRPPGPVLQVGGGLPVDFRRYNRPVDDTRAQRRR